MLAATTRQRLSRAIKPSVDLPSLSSQRCKRMCSPKSRKSCKNLHFLYRQYVKRLCKDPPILYRVRVRCFEQPCTLSADRVISVAEGWTVSFAGKTSAHRDLPAAYQSALRLCSDLFDPGVIARVSQRGAGQDQTPSSSLRHLHSEGHDGPGIFGLLVFGRKMAQ